MSSLNSLQVTGVRSFGPNNRQNVHFQSPLTLIVGQNGSGKTTLIECLRYISTGEMPSGTVNVSKNANFAHDLNISGFDECLSQVKLKFFDVSKDPVVAVRSMKSIKKKVAGRTKIECSTMDGVISKYDKRTGETINVASKCADMNREMSGLLGVSDAVLNNVIFCHQEDSNWPLSEPKALKNRFDDIFSATKYMKALDAMRNLHKDLTRNVAEYKKELGFLDQFREKANDCRQNMEADQDKLNKLGEEADKLRTEIEPIDQKLKEIGQHQERVRELESSIFELKASKKAIEDSITDLRRNITDDFAGGMEELKKELDEFETAKRDIITEIEARKRDLEKLNKKESLLEKEKEEEVRKQGQLETEVKHNKSQMENRDKAISKFAAELDYKGFSHTPLLDTDAADFLRRLEQSISQTNDDSKKAKAEFEKGIREAKAESEIASNAVSANKNAKRSNEDALKQVDHDIREADSFMKDIQNKEARLTQISAEIANAETKLQIVKSEVDEDALKKEIAKLETERREMETKLRSLHADLKVANEQKAFHLELQMLEKDKSAKENELQKLLDKHSDALNQFFRGVDISRLKHAVEDDLLKREGESKLALAKLKDKERSQQGKEKEREMCNEELKKKEKQVLDEEAKIFEICQGDEVDEELIKIEEALKKLHFDKGTVDGSENIYESYIKKLQSRPCCPLCERNFADDQDANELSEKLKRDIRLLPDRSSQLRRKIEGEQKRQADLLQVKPLVDAVNKLKNNEIPSLRKRIEKLNSEIKSIKKEIEELQPDYEMQLDDEKSIRAIQNDLGQIDALNRQIRNVQGRLTSLKNQIGDAVQVRSAEAIDEEIGNLQMVIDEITTSLRSKQEIRTNYRDKVQRLSQNINDMTKEKLDLTNSMQQQVVVMEKRKTLAAQRETHIRSIEQLKREEAGLRGKLDECRAKEAKLEKEKDDRWTQFQSRIKSLEKYHQIVQDYDESIAQFRSSGKSDRLRRCVDRLAIVERELEDISKDFQEKTRQNEAQAEKLNRSETKLRQLQDRISIEEKRAQIVDLDEEIGTKRREFDRLGGELTNKREFDKILGKRSDLTKRLHEIEGNMQVLKGNVRKSEQLLQTEGYRNAGEKYDDKLVQAITTETAASDVQKYWRALDNAIIQYHSSKMEAINEVLREYWQKIYKHNDIDFIAIRSAAESSESGAATTAASTTNRRVYNYRVVMNTGGAELDMRGRCSAGQKVLASVLIRIALAEVFSGNCGVLALDEPTTNLDAANCQGLAEALVDLIELRSQQENFQLILITHDEQFVRTLLQGYPMEKHYRVRKNDDGYSEIAEMTSSDLD